MKKLLALLLALVMVFALAACGGGTDPSAESPGAVTDNGSDGEKVTIRFWQAGGDTAGATEVMTSLLNKFMEENEDIVVEYQAYPWANDPHTIFQTAIAGNDVADLLVVHAIRHQDDATELAGVLLLQIGDDLIQAIGQASLLVVIDDAIQDWFYL